MNKIIDIDKIPAAPLNLLRLLEGKDNAVFVADLPEKLRHPDVLGWLMDPEHRHAVCFQNGDPNDPVGLEEIARELEGRAREAAPRESAPATAKTEHFERYARDRLAVAFELEALPGAVASDYWQWCRDERVPRADRLNKNDLEVAILRLPGVSKGLTQTRSSVKTRQHGYLGMALCEPDDKPTDILERVRSRRIRIVLARRGEALLRDQRLAGESTKTEDTPKPEVADRFLSVSELARTLDFNPKALRERLRRAQSARRIADRDIEERSNPRPREPRYLYRLSAVRSLIDAK